jgi:hypothetical protein
MESISKDEILRLLRAMEERQNAKIAAMEAAIKAVIAEEIRKLGERLDRRIDALETRYNRASPPPQPAFEISDETPLLPETQAQPITVSEDLSKRLAPCTLFATTDDTSVEPVPAGKIKVWSDSATGTYRHRMAQSNVTSALSALVTPPAINLLRWQLPITTGLLLLCVKTAGIMLHPFDPGGNM